jgi:hypothetical protein
VTEGDIGAMTLRDMLERGERVTVVDVRKGRTMRSGRYPEACTSTPTTH